MKNKWLLGAAAAVVLTGGAIPAVAGTPGLDVYVGYADGLRASGFQPNPWDGSPNVVFDGISDTGNDTGAIRFDNNTGGSITIHDLKVTLPDNVSATTAFYGTAYSRGGTGVYQPWTSDVTLLNGQIGIFDETAHYNLDTSDHGYMPSGTHATDGDPNSPIVSFSLDGGATTQSNTDSGHVLDTYGFDLANLGNESIGWHIIGTDAINRNNQSPVPEPAFYQMGGMLALGALGYVRRRRRA